MDWPKLRFYRLYLRTFAPWKVFAWKAATGTFAGDDRGFSTEVVEGVTARINASCLVNPYARICCSEQCFCHPTKLVDRSWLPVNPSAIPYAPPGIFVQTKAIATGTLKIINFVTQNKSWEMDASISGKDPLVIGAPDINWTLKIGFVPYEDKDGRPMLDVKTMVVGDRFPAFEAFLDDQYGGKIFVGAYAPPSKNQIIRLLGYLNQIGYCRKWRMKIGLNTNFTFSSVSGEWEDSCEGASTWNSKQSWPLKTWNENMIASIPMPSDAGS